MKNGLIQLILCLVFVQSSLFGQIDHVDISGAMSAGVTAFEVSNDQQYNQMDAAFNVDFSFPISDELEGFFQFQGSVGESYLGFAGTSIVLTDINFTYNPKNRHFKFTLGSFDTPFGRYIQYLTNNADMSSNMFVKNPLLYATLAGYAGTLNTVGVMSVIDFSFAETIVAVTNGTAETANNDDETFEYVFNFKPKFSDIADLSISYMYSDDRGNTSSFNTIFSGWMLDFEVDFLEKFKFKSYLSTLVYDDSNALTTGEVFSYLLELNYDVYPYIFSVRYDVYNRADIYLVNSDIPNVFFSSSNLANGSIYEQIDSIGLSMKYYLSDDFILSSELFTEIGDGSSQTVGGFVYFTSLF